MNKNNLNRTFFRVSAFLINGAALLFTASLLCFALLPKAGFSFEQVLSESMRPAFSTEDLLLCDLRAGELSEGEIAVFRKGGMRIFHRVLEKLPEGYRTGGDANDSPDGFVVKPEEIEGRCVAVIRGGRKFLLFIRSPYFFAAAGLFLILQGETVSRKMKEIYQLRETAVPKKRQERSISCDRRRRSKGEKDRKGESRKSGKEQVISGRR